MDKSNQETNGEYFKETQKNLPTNVNKLHFMEIDSLLNLKGKLYQEQLIELDWISKTRLN